MAKVSTIAEVLELPDDTIVHVFKATITKMYARKEGTGEKGPWSFEDLYGKDASGAEIKITLKDRPKVDDSIKGKTVYFFATKTDKGWHGVKTKDDVYDGKTRRIVWVTGTAEIMSAGAYEAEQQAGSASSQKPAPQQTSQTTAPEPQRPAPAKQADGCPSPQDSLFQCRQFAGRRISLLKIATRAVLAFKKEFDALPAEIKQGVVFDNEVFWGRVTTLYISLESQGLAMRSGWGDGLPKNITFDKLEIVVPAASKSAILGKEPAPQAPPQPPPPPPKPKCGRCGADLDEANLCPKCDDDVPF